MAPRWSDGRRRPPALLGAERLNLSVPDGPRRARPKGGPIIPPRRLPALHPLAWRGKEKGEGRARVHKNRAGGALAVRNFACKKMPLCYDGATQRGSAFMSVDAATVCRIAHLARIAVAEEEVENLKGELNSILAFVEQLSEVNVDGV